MRFLFLLPVAIFACVASIPASNPDPDDVVTWDEWKSNGTPIKGKEVTKTITQATSDFLQVRATIILLDVGMPDSEGLCKNGHLTITGQANELSPICGYTSEEGLYNLYLHFNENIDPIVFHLTSSLENPQWEISFLQLFPKPDINPFFNDFAPFGCSQYSRFLAQMVESFNFPKNPVDALKSGTRQLANMNDYKVCVSLHEPRCKVVWTTNLIPAIRKYSFFLTGKNIPDSEFGKESGIKINDECTTDYIHFPGNATFTNSAGQTITASRFCGHAFPESVTANEPVFYVHTNDREAADGDENNLGFSLQYSQDCPEY